MLYEREPIATGNVPTFGNWRSRFAIPSRLGTWTDLGRAWGLRDLGRRLRSRGVAGAAGHGAVLHGQRWAGAEATLKNGTERAGWDGIELRLERLLAHLEPQHDQTATSVQ